MAHEPGQQVGADPAAGEDPDRADVRAVGRMAGILQGMPRLLQEQALLRIDNRGFARRVAEEVGVERVEIGQLADPGDVVRAHLRRIRQWGGAVRDLPQVRPEFVDVSGLGEQAGPADDRDRVLSIGRRVRPPVRRADILRPPNPGCHGWLSLFARWRAERRKAARDRAADFLGVLGPSPSRGSVSAKSVRNSVSSAIVVWRNS